MHAISHNGEWILPMHWQFSTPQRQVCIPHPVKISKFLSSEIKGTSYKTNSEHNICSL